MRDLMIIAVTLALGLQGVAVADNGSEAPRRFIFAGASGEALLHQCSRALPQGVTGYWTPEPKDIEILEAELIPALDSDPLVRRSKRGFPTRDLLQRYHRQYAGILIGGEKFVYGNFYPAPHDLGLPWKLDEFKTPRVICDGGIAFFGVVYRVPTQTIESLTFNGVA